MIMKHKWRNLPKFLDNLKFVVISLKLNKVMPAKDVGGNANSGYPNQTDLVLHCFSQTHIV